ncbi:MAG TPA: alanine--tRNA ligase [Acidimicrobiia bacterium]|nr:alanine--tRNA ligase [Acidimicrobiia bacterium]
MPSRPRPTADRIRQAFLDFFASRGHTVVPSASVVPIDASLLFTNSGMVPFKSYFVGDEAPPYRRAVSAQKCVRAGGKHNDLEEVGRTNRHFTFFEMLGNFSFGDYFKAEVIPWSWAFLTEDLGLDPERIWVTVHADDHEAAGIWRDVVGLPAERIQHLGDETNFWRMANAGPCGPNSEIFWDLGPDAGPGGGPAVSEDRFIEIWNLVFMQLDERSDGEMAPLPAPSIDTGAGLDRLLAVLQGVPTVWDTDVMRPIIARAEQVTGVGYGGFPGGEQDVSLRILAEHGRTMTFIVGAGIVPSNEERGYVLRRIIRRAVRHGYLLGVDHPVTPALVDATIDVMGGAYPDLGPERDSIKKVVGREEERFRTTLARGVQLLDEIMARGDVGGDDAFYLHDTLGFPIELTREIAAERGRTVDAEGFATSMQAQRSRAREATKPDGDQSGTPVERYRELLDAYGPTEFTGRQEYETTGAKVLALIAGPGRVLIAGPGDRVQVLLDRTPFYAESGGQVGDIGELRTESATLRVTDTQYALAGTLVAHTATVERGEIHESDAVDASIDGQRRDRIRRNHTATHILHWALRDVLGPHVKQAGSHVGPDRLRFDFSHFEAVTPAELDRIESLTNHEIITDAPVRHYETSKEHAAELGAIAFFGDKYGDVVRVLEAGERSIELCGGTHVHALGFIGPVKIVSEGSIGSNLRRIEAVTGDGALARIHDEELELRRAAGLLHVGAGEVGERVEKVLAELKGLHDELDALRARQASVEAVDLAQAATDGVVAVRRDGLAKGDLQRLATSTRDALGSGVVVIAGVADDKPGLAVAVTKNLVAAGVSAATIAAPAAKLLGGGTNKGADLAIGGGKDPTAVDDALALARTTATEAVGSTG